MPALENNAGLQTAARTLLRLAFGFLFLAHGWQKYFQFTIEGTIAAFGQMGVPAANLLAPVAATLEIAGGAAIILGLLTRVFAGLLGVQMIVALFMVHAAGGVFVENGGFELVLALAAGALALLLVGPGRISLDALIFKGKKAGKALVNA
ncbi:DoxX family protein [Glutamicibacter nicotianae]|uniref:DoxX family protein n=1 Tax=Glutamicibacter nicotianae TaxID=37929 RepID=UPI001958E4A8|nr:DoxX family protein [Glutamicibacter nicotianae]MBM7769199.1 putative oxidoreductase [Glutamicibacter nicotianae]